MKIAVTAVSGQLGSAITNELCERIGTENIVGTARTPEKVQHLPVEVRKGDYDSFEDFNQALKDCDAVIIVSGNAAPENRIQQHRNIIDAAVKNGLKKIVYTSIVSSNEDHGFNAVVRSNRQTEEDIRNSGTEWAIGRNGLYLEPDLEYVDNYMSEGGIVNCANDGKCAYTDRTELAKAYAHLVLEDKLNGQTYQLTGAGITQQELAKAINKQFGTDLKYVRTSVEEYRNDRQQALGNHLGTIIAGIYEGISKGAFDVSSDFERVTGKPHASVEEMIERFLKEK